MDKQTYEAGVAVRTEVMGQAHVQRTAVAPNDFDRPLRDLITEYAWGAVWARPGLDRKLRSVLNLGMLTALGRPEELRIHVKGALNNGLTAEEIREALLQTAIYCGVPAALEAFRVAKAVLKEEGAI